MEDLILSAALNFLKRPTGLRFHQRHCSKFETQFEKERFHPIFEETISYLFTDECYLCEIKIELKKNYMPM